MTEGPRPEFEVFPASDGEAAIRYAPLTDDVPRTVADAEAWIRTAVGDALAERLGPNSGEIVHKLMDIGRDVYLKLMENDQFRRRLAMGERAERLTRIETRWPDSYDEGWNAYHDRIRGVTDGA